MTWDPTAAAHLQELALKIEAAGVTSHLRGVVTELWRANVERFDPDAIFDDSSTLGYTSARNVTNRVFTELRGRSGALQPAAFAVRDNQSTVTKVDDIEIHFIKARVDRGRSPRFTTDFRWDQREGRLVPATRNFERYIAPQPMEGIAPLFAVELPNATERIAACRDVFMVWAGDLEGRTAGWYGLPTSGAGSWLAVEPAWFDEDNAGMNSPKRPIDPLSGRNFSQMEEPTPQISLKPQLGEGSIDG
jgi:hypothetical protein